MLLLALLACTGEKDLDEADDGDDTRTSGETECVDDEDCGTGRICVSGACVDGDRNNAPGEAEALLWGDTVEGVINPDDDVDFYVFTAEGGEYVRVTTTVPEDESFDTVVTLRDGSGKVVTSADAFATGTGVTGVDAVLFAYLAEAGDYTLEVQDVATASGEGGDGYPDYTYTLSLEEWPEACVEIDARDAPGSSQSLSDARIWYSVGARLDPGDTDWIAVGFGLDGQNLYVDGNADLSGSDATPRVRLWDGAGNLLGEKVNVGPDDYLLYPHLADGDYLVELTDDAGGGENAWTFAHLISRPDVDGYPFTASAEPDDDQEQANALPLTEWENSGGDPYVQAQGQGTLDAPGDEDWFYLDSPYEDGGLVFCLSSAVWGSLAAPDVTVQDDAGNQLGADEGSMTAVPNANLDNMNIDAGRVFIRISAPADAVTGPGAWYRFYVYAASFAVSDYADGGYGCP